jgi:hypothetical protein
MNSLMRQIFFTALSISVLLCPLASAQTPANDFLPLAVGNTWTYRYFVEDDNTQGDTYTSDSGKATYTILSRTTTADSITWSLKEVRLVRHSYSFFFHHTHDTTYTLNDSLTFDLIEHLDGDHRLSRTVEFYSCWKTAFPLAEDAVVFSDSLGGFVRYRPNASADSVNQTAGSHPILNYPPNENVRLNFQRNVGIQDVAYWLQAITGAINLTHHTLLQATVTSVAPSNEAPVASVFKLWQNYPNPFNPTTTIRFTLPRRAHVTLAVFDGLGRPVAVLLDDERESGVHDLVFDASALSSGVYFYRLHAGDFRQTMKLVLLH